MPKPKKTDEFEQQIGELTADLQRVRADFENYRKRVEGDLERAKETGERKAVTKILPILDLLDQVFVNMPDDLRETDYGKGIILTMTNVTKTCAELNLVAIPVKVGAEFNHDFMHAVQFDENSEGDKEVVAEVLQGGYAYNGEVLRPAMVRVVRK